jgi:hypothetical protein
MPEENLTTTDSAVRRVDRRSAGDRTPDRVPTTETVGDPDEGSPEAAGEAGAATGAIVGTVLGGPLGMAAGAGIGAAAGLASEADADDAPTRDAQRKAEQIEEWRRDHGNPESSTTRDDG